jgi:RecA-family ATPase
MPTLIVDFETRSTVNLKRCGASRYAADPSTDVLCVGYKLDDGGAKLWFRGDPVPEAFIEAARAPDYKVVAFNAGFERAHYDRILVPRYGFPALPLAKWACIQAAALAHALPASLEGVGAALSLLQQKDIVAGRKILKRVSVPRKPQKGEDPEGIYWNESPEDLAELGAYNLTDVNSEYCTHSKVGFLSDAEQAIWLLDQVINDRGIYIDRNLAIAANAIAGQVKPDISAELQALTEGAVESVHQSARLQEWLGENGCTVTGVDKTTLRKALTRKQIPDCARRAIELRLAGAPTSASKLDAMLNWAHEDGRVRGCFKYHGAKTGRWASWGIQLQNLKKPNGADIDALIKLVLTGDTVQVRAAGLEPMNVVGDLTRAMICAAPGHRFLIGDFSGIESRVLAWLAGQTDKIQLWINSDRSGTLEHDVYYQLGLKLGFPPENARALGKICDLAFGYMGGVGAFRAVSPDDDRTDEQIKALQQAWQAAHQYIVALGKALDRAAIRAVQNPVTVVKLPRPAWQWGSFVSDGLSLRLTLPSGRALNYPFPELKVGKFDKPVVSFKESSLGKWEDCRHGQGAYSGIWLENVTQAVARDILAEAMLRLEAAGYKVVLHVHDEIVCEMPDRVGSVEEFKAILETPPAWAATLPLSSKVRNGPRFSKSSSKPAQATDEPPFQPTHEEPIESDEPAEEQPAEPEIAPEEQPAAEEPKAERTQEPPRQERRHSSDGHVHGDDTRQRKGGKCVGRWIYPSLDQPNYLRVDKILFSDGDRKFYQHHWNGTQWISGVEGTYAERKIPYRLPELKAALQADPDVEVHIAEGEKDGDTLAKLGYVATTNPGGALSWTADLTAWFRILGVRRAIIHEDNDDKGRKRTPLLIAALGGFIKLRVVKYLDAPEGEDVTWWLTEGNHTAEELAERIKAAPFDAPAPLPFIDMSRWDHEPVPEQEWTVFDKIPRRQPALFSGEGGAGKSMEGLHLCSAHVLGRDCWFSMPERGPAIFIDAEDDERVVHQRLAAVIDHYEVTFADLIKNGLHLISYAGKDAVMATVSRNGKIEPTAIYRQILQAAVDIKPVQIVIASSANVFSGNEIDRSQVQQFAGLLTAITMASNGSLVLCSHPSLTGISSGTGLSGTTQWHNAMRARLYMKGVKPESGAQPDTDLREIEFKKNQYGKMSDKIVLRYQAGMYLPVPGASIDKLAREAQAEEIFLELLRRLTTENRYVSDKKSPAYAPAVFAREEAASKAGITSGDFAEAMRRLFAARKIWNEPCGRPSRPTYRIALKT